MLDYNAFMPHSTSSRPTNRGTNRRFKAKFHYTIQLATSLRAGLRPADLLASRIV